MKKIIIYVFLLFFTIIEINIVAQNQLKKQTPKTACLKNISIYREFQKIKLYNRAAVAWESVYTECPKIKKYIYTDGVKIYRKLIDKEKNTIKKEKLINKLLEIYDNRIKYFGDEGFVIGKKGLDLIRYRKKDIDIAYKYLSKSIELRKENAGAGVVLAHMQITMKFYKEDKKNSSEAINNYINSYDIIRSQIVKNKNKLYIKKLLKVKYKINKSFKSSNIYKTNLYSEMLKNRYKENFNDYKKISLIQNILESTNKIETELYKNVSLRLYEYSKQAYSSYKIARYYMVNKNYVEAVKYLDKSIETEINSKRKSKYYYDLALINLSGLNNIPKAKMLVSKSIGLNKKYGKAYILLGDIYVAASSIYGNNNFEQRAMYWLAVDKYKIAKSIDKKYTKIANKKIYQYKDYFPAKNDIFFNGYKAGDKYHIKSWINETTKIRART